MHLLQLHFVTDLKSTGYKSRVTMRRPSAGPIR